MFLQNSGQFAAQGKKCRESDVQQSFLRGKGVSPPVRIRSRTSFRSLQQASHRERISSVGCCRSGTMTVTAGEQVVAEIPILAGEEVPRVTYGQMLMRLLRTAFLSD